MRLFDWLNRHMAAAAFAEAGEFETCREILRRHDRGRKRTRPQARPEAPRPRLELRAPSDKQ